MFKKYFQNLQKLFGKGTQEMSEEKKKTYRLFKVSAELNVAIDTLADALREKGFEVSKVIDPNTKITSDMYEFLVDKYAQDKQSKEKATRQKLAQKEQTVTRVRKPLVPLEEAEAFDPSPLTAFELRQKLSQPPTAEPSRPPLVPEPMQPPLVAEPEAERPRRLEPADEPKPTPGGLVLDLPPLPDFLKRPSAPPAEPSPAEAPTTEPETQAQPAEPQPAESTATPTPEAVAPETASAPPTEPQPETPEAPTPPPASEPVAPPESPRLKAEPPAINLKIVGKVDLDQVQPRRTKRKTEPKPASKAEPTPTPATEPVPVAKAPEPQAEPVTEAPAEPLPADKPTEASTPQPKLIAPDEPTTVAEAPAPAEPAAEPVAATPEPLPTPPTEPIAPEPAVPPTSPEAVPVAEKTEPEAPPAVAPTDEPQAPAEKVEKPEPEAPAVIRASDHAPKLSGLKIMGKIDLTADMVGRRSLRSDNKDKDKEKEKEKTKAKADDTPKAAPPPASAAPAATAEPEKRKRKRKRKSATPEASTSPTSRTTLRPTGGKAAAGTAKNNAAKASSEATKKEAASNLRTTLGAINRAPSRKRQTLRKEKRTQRATIRQQQFEQELAEANVLEVTEYLTANELATLMDVSVNEVIAKCMELGLIVSINQRINAEVISLIAEEFGYQVKFVSVDEAFATDDDDEDDPDELEPRHPIVTVMGHVDHGKTSLLDYIRKTNVTKGEAGGITQHIGAYEVKLPDGRRITFLDTPGHEAFTAMRARGAQVTDIAIIVIAADDQVMPQTREAINHAQAAGVKMVFAINKIDKPGAKPDVIRQQLAEMNLLVEEWGGPYQCQEISAKQGTGIDELLEKVLLEAELLELKANPNRPARGTVIEAQLDRGRGVVATLLVQNGTLNVGDIVVANCHYGRVKAMFDDKQRKIKKAGPSTPVQILGLDGVPQAGDKFQVMESDREARELATRRQQLLREQTIRMHKNITLEEIARRSALGDFQELNIIVKGDVDGSVEALADSLIKLSTDEVAVKIIMKGVGEISESDVLLASASNAIIVGFQVRPSANARKLIQQESVDVRLYSVIYDAINEIKDALEGLLKPKIEEEVVGVAEVRETFRVAKVGTIAGCMVVEGKITRNSAVRVIRDGIVQYTGKIGSLRRFKDDVREVAEGFECGIGIENYNDIKVGDVLEVYVTKEVKRTID